jgi:malic enzyme
MEVGFLDLAISERMEWAFRSVRLQYIVMERLVVSIALPHSFGCRRLRTSGKLSLYCAAGGIAPHRVLPVVLDVGTDNDEVRNDPFYMGVQEKRLKGEEYFYMIDEFMDAVRFRWPNVLVQFEDFSSSVAQTLLDKYRDDHLCFNDDIQGTGATTLAAIMGALRAKGQDVTSLGDQKIVIAGAGSAGIGIANVLLQAMVEQGQSVEKAKESFYICDNKG